MRSEIEEKEVMVENESFFNLDPYKNIERNQSQLPTGRFMNAAPAAVY